MIEFLGRPDGLMPPNGYSHVAVGVGRVVSVSGQLPVDEAGAIVHATHIAVQARQVFSNVGRALEAAGASARHVLKLTLFLTDLNDLAAVRDARDEFLADGCAPTSSLIQVVGLVLPDARIEVDALAVVDA